MLISARLSRPCAATCRRRDVTRHAIMPRREVIALAPLVVLFSNSKGAQAKDVNMLDTNTPMTALKDKDYGKSRLRYPDFTETKSGLQFKDFREGSGDTPKDGDTVIFDWDGYTIGYYGRPFEARNKPKGSSFTGENKDFVRVVLGRDELIPAVEEAIRSMKVGGIRRIVVPEELGYPAGDWRKKGPTPSTFAGERALGFVLENKGMIDKTLLIDIDLKNVIKGR